MGLIGVPIVVADASMRPPAKRRKNGAGAGPGPALLRLQ